MMWLAVFSLGVPAMAVDVPPVLALADERTSAVPAGDEMRLLWRWRPISENVGHRVVVTANGAQMIAETFLTAAIEVPLVEGRCQTEV